MASHQSKITPPDEQELQVEKAGSISPPGRGTGGGVRGPPAHHSPLRRVLVQPPRFDGGRERGGGGGAFHAVAERAGAAAGESGSGQARAGAVVTPAAATAGDEEPREGVKSWRFAGGGGQARPPTHASASPCPSPRHGQRKPRLFASKDPGGSPLGGGPGTSPSSWDSRHPDPSPGKGDGGTPRATAPNSETCRVALCSCTHTRAHPPVEY